MRLLNYAVILMALGINISSTFSAPQDGPKITVVLIADQFAHFYLPKLSKHFKYGLRTLLDEGKSYENVFHPHAIPETTTGHHTLSTGCYPKDHGGITNQWLDKDGEKIRYENDASPETLVLPESNPPIGKSNRNSRADTLCDQFVRYSSLETPTKALVLSIKNYAAISTAGGLGQPVWFDEQRGFFVSSKKYGSHLPKWVQRFNKHLEKKYFNKTWHLCYDKDDECYNFPHIKNYDFAAYKEGFIDKSYKTAQTGKDPYYFIVRSPIANQMIFDLARAYIDKKISPDGNEHLMLWLSLSQLDLLTHLFGPDSLETTDTIYHLDKQIGSFLSYLHRRFGTENCLTVFTADHGVAPIPELQRLKGYSSAQRIMSSHLISLVNSHIQKKYKINNIVKGVEPNSLRLNHDILDKLPQEKQTEIKQHICSILRTHPGIKKAWTYERLAQKPTTNNFFTHVHKMQLYPGRIGDIICQPEPHCQITAYPTGTSHSTPYDYDIHVPLIFHYPKTITPGTNLTRIMTPQIPVAIAQLLHINPSAGATFSTIPGLN